MPANILIRHHLHALPSVRCRCEAEGHDCCLEQRSDTPCDSSINYLIGVKRPNFPVPAIPLIHQWDFLLWVLLETMPPMTDDEWEREENEWQDYLDNLDNET